MLVVNVVYSQWCLRMDATVIPGGLEVNYQIHDDEEAEFEREELERQNEVKHYFNKAVVSWIKIFYLWTHAQRCVHVIFCQCFFHIFFYSRLSWPNG